MGQELVFDGKTYIASKALARHTGYTHDYISRLCREGKVNGRLVGRSWFVEPVSLDEHQKEKKEIKHETGKKVTELYKASREMSPQPHTQKAGITDLSTPDVEIAEPHSTTQIRETAQKDRWEETLFSSPADSHVSMPEESQESHPTPIAIHKKDESYTLQKADSVLPTRATPEALARRETDYVLPKKESSSKHYSNDAKSTKNMRNVRKEIDVRQSRQIHASASSPRVVRVKSAFFPKFVFSTAVFIVIFGAGFWALQNNTAFKQSTLALLYTLIDQKIVIEID